MADKEFLRFCLGVITEESRPARRSRLAASTVDLTEELMAEAATTTEASRSWVADDGIQGIGIGEKITAGRPTGELALRVYVAEKRPSATIAHEVPSAVSIGGHDAATDVIEIGELDSELFTDRVRPVRPGLSVGLDGGEPGTLGAIVRRRGDGRICALSNSHVLADYGRAAVGDPVVQPASSEPTATDDDVIGTLARFEPFEFTDSGFPNRVDAAIAELDVDHEVVVREIEIAPRGINIRPRVGMTVQKVGRTSDHSIGVIKDTDFRAVLRYPDAAGTKRRVGFHDQILCSRYTAGGDSGSLVLSSSGLAVGLHFAGSPSVSVFNRITNVLEDLDVDLVTG